MNPGRAAPGLRPVVAALGKLAAVPAFARPPVMRAQAALHSPPQSSVWRTCWRDEKLNTHTHRNCAHTIYVPHPLRQHHIVVSAIVISLLLRIRVILTHICRSHSAFICSWSVRLHTYFSPCCTGKGYTHSTTHMYTHIHTHTHTHTHWYRVSITVSDSVLYHELSF